MSANISSQTKSCPTRIRYVVLPFLAFAAASAYLTRHGLAAANTTMQEGLGFNNEQFGLLYIAFSLGYLKIFYG
ncbi:MAG: sugar phosphate permease [Verrucomicrobiales bacterium]